ncbi:MAG: DNA-deoxyinosine glycosylase [Burkholderiales bacterium]|nr:DNA-deoxyinosine glycosylase [Burkholderiales bacterium]
MSGKPGGGAQVPRLRGFEPIADARARVLVLGSFPSEASLAAGHYYAHPRNQFWRLMSSVLGQDLLQADWPTRYAALRDNRIALWDSVDACERAGSLDADIRQPEANDLGTLVARLPELRRIVFNGATAARQARRLAESGFEIRVLPSSSPAHAAMRFEAKCERWQEALSERLPAHEREPAPDSPRPATRGRHRSVAVPINLSEFAGVRYLHFGTPWVQGAMLMAHPNLLVLDYIQRMMAWLLFLSPPAEILQLGLGAGSLTRFVHARLPPSRITVVEYSRDVIEVTRSFFALPADDARLQVHCDEAERFVARPALAGRFGVIQVDLYDEEARGPAVDSEAFYRGCRRLLAEPGICVVNLFGSHRSFAPNRARLSAAFDGRLLELPANREGNRIVLAFAGPPLRIEWSALEERARWLEQRFGWPATVWCRLLKARRRRAVCEV